MSDSVNRLVSRRAVGGQSSDGGVKDVPDAAPLAPRPDPPLKTALLLSIAVIMVIVLCLVGASAYIRVRDPTAYASARNQKFWWDLHANYSAQAELALKSQEVIDIVFYGDSITEWWTGRDRGSELVNHPGIAEVWQQHFAGKYNVRNWAIGADRIGNLMWRMKHGELLPGMRVKVVVLLIGTNDIGHVLNPSRSRLNDEALRTAANLEAMVRYVREAWPSTEIVLQELLPRGPRFYTRPGVAAPHRFVQPSMFTGAISIVNSRIRSICASVVGVHCVACGHLFLSRDGKSLVEALMPDALHPSRDGYRAYAPCVQAAVDKAFSAYSAQLESNGV